MKNRIIYGILIVLFTFAMIGISSVTRLIFFLLCAVLSCREMVLAFRKCGYNPRLWPSVAAAAAGAALMYFHQTQFILPAIFLIFFAVITMMILTGHPVVRDVFSSAAICMYPLAPALLFMYICTLDCWPSVFLLGIVSSVVSDTFALFGGKCFGKHKLAPVISPNKTVEGLLCGVTAGTLSVFISHLILNALNAVCMPLWAEVICAFAATLFGALGDLFASAIKRAAKIKDYSNLIPGHGGVLDRIDAQLFAIPIVYFISLLF